MKRFSTRGPDDDLEAQLRAARPQAPPELTRAIADRLHPPRSGSRRMRLGLASGLSVIGMGAAVALGGGSFAVGAVSDRLNPAKSAADRHGGRDRSPAGHQYGSPVTVCIRGRVEVRLPRGAAHRVVARGVATLGPCQR